MLRILVSKSLSIRVCGHRRRLVIAFPLVIALVAMLANCACDTRRFDFQGRSRSYLLHIPQTLDAQSRPPLLIALHGRLGTGSGMARTSGFDALVDKHGIVVAYPDGIERSWADGRGGSPAEQAGVDDVGFIDALIDHVMQELSIDPKRIYVVGISNGGMMAQRLACELTPRLAAVASIIASMPQALQEQCQPLQNLSVVLMNGTEDPLVPYSGGAVESDAGGVVLSTSDTISHWAKHNSCESTATHEELDNKDDGTKVVHERYMDCAGNSAVDLYEIQGGGHTWPGGPQYLSVDTIGLVSQEIDAATAIWEFISQHTRE